MDENEEEKDGEMDNKMTDDHGERDLSSLNGLNLYMEC